MGKEPAEGAKQSKSKINRMTLSRECQQELRKKKTRYFSWLETTLVLAPFGNQCNIRRRTIPEWRGSEP